ncbi:MAG: hypothetical protein A3F68_04135 [Acidobacteria bacterium RIFCSPLOWO2_12_FULL_54_10]|nr:MAG: hypothetical protein A3F68_04135 [Acidobacteria bacterium RIFCSPLOWO2_12_FULL_54_10]
MNNVEATMKVYTVVDVVCGVAVEAKCFRRLKEARAYLRQLRKGRNLGEDDVQLFECRLDKIS